MKYQKVDPVSEMIPVRPVVHYMMGGIDTDIQGATVLDGLFAAGEVACVNINGANRLGSNSLTELLVFGARAGRAAARSAASQPAPGEALIAQAQDEERRLKKEFLDASGPERIAPLRKEMQEAMEAGAGIYRSEDGLTESVETVRSVRERFQRIGLDDHSRTFNTELVAALELSNLLDVAGRGVGVGARTQGVPRSTSTNGLSRAGRRRVPRSLPGRPARTRACPGSSSNR